jgi:hypothetical protein
VERAKTPNNILDRLDDLEKRVRELMDYSLVPQDASGNPEEPGWNMLTGWIMTGTQLRDMYGRIILDSATPYIQLATGGYMRSSDFVTGVAGWQITGGTSEFNHVTVRGTIYATAGSIGGPDLDGPRAGSGWGWPGC